jgi:hypothetical protein
MESFKLFLKKITPISEEDFKASLPYFSDMHLKKGDYFVRPNLICKHIAYISSGTMRAFYYNDKAEEITSCFCTANNLTTSFKSFILL